jgi:hypothetical protein
MLGALWAMAPIRTLCHFNEGSAHDAVITLVHPMTLDVSEDDPEWVLEEVRARTIVAGIVGLVSLVISLSWIMKKGSANRAMEDTSS